MNKATNPNIRCRFAPSPTGYLHLGGARTALFNYLFARASGGTFILRIEDTDLERSTQEAVDAIFQGLDWLAIVADEGPFFQTKRMDLYATYAQKLLASGHAYRCYATAAELDEMREAQRQRNEKPRYDGRYRPASVEPQDTTLPSKAETKPFVIRFRAPQGGATVFSDLVLGDVATPNEELEDFIIVRSDGTPTYNFCVVVDDVDMRISHVIRGSDHISNTPKQVAIYQALGANIPKFVHVPMILGEDKKKLSKRHGATSVIEYRKDGYLADAFVNYLVRLGWSHGDQEIFSRAELEQIFDLENIGKSAAVFDFQKLRWVNSEHLKKVPMDVLWNSVQEFFQGAPERSPGLEKLLDCLRERSATLKEMADACSWYFLKDDALEISEEQKKKAFTQTALPVYQDLIHLIEGKEALEETDMEKAFQALLEKHSLPMGKLGLPVRLALTASSQSPSVYSLFQVLGKKRSLERLRRAEAWFS